MTFFTPIIAGKPFEISNTSEGLVRADRICWMRIILFRYRKKDNKQTARKWRASLFVAVLLIFGASNLIGQEPWRTPLTKCWEVIPETQPVSLAASDNETVFFSSSNGTITALNTASGTVKWHTDFGGNLGSEIFGSYGRVFSTSLFGDGPGRISKTVFREIDPNSGVPKWTFEEESEIPLNFALFRSGGLFLYSSKNVVLLDSRGTEKWRRDYNIGISTVPSEGMDDSIVFGTSNRSIMALKALSGEMLFQINAKTAPVSLAPGNNGHFYTGDSKGGIYAISKEQNTPIWNTKTGGGISLITTIEDDLIALSKDNFVYRISGDNGKKIWKRKLAGRILGLASLDESHAVFTTTGSSTAVLLDLRDGRLINKFDANGGDFVGGPVKIQNGFAVATQNAVTAVTNRACNK